MLRGATILLERLEARMRARVEHPFRVLKCQFGFTKVRYRRLAKNTAQLQTLIAPVNLSLARRRVAAAAYVRPPNRQRLGSGREEARKGRRRV